MSELWLHSHAIHLLYIPPCVLAFGGCKLSILVIESYIMNDLYWMPNPGSGLKPIVKIYIGGKFHTVKGSSLRAQRTNIKIYTLDM